MARLDNPQTSSQAKLPTLEESPFAKIPVRLRLRLPDAYFFKVLKWLTTSF
jgi:hypothetical protein